MRRFSCRGLWSCGLLLACKLLSWPLAAQTTIPLLLPNGIAYDTAGNLYIVDTNRNQVFEATLGGQLLTVAGTGVQGFSGDGGAATAAQLNRPRSIAIALDGTIYIADTGNQRIRAIVNGTIQSFAGTGTAGFSGDGGAPSLAELRDPSAVALDNAGALLVCDTGNHRIRRVAAGLIMSLAGSGVQGFSGDGGAAALAEFDAPSGVAVTPDGRVFIADTRNHRVRVIDASGVVTTFAGTGVPGYSGDGAAATAAQLFLPKGLGFDAAGDLLIADANNQRIRMVNSSGTIATLAGSGIQGGSADAAPATAAFFNTPRAVALSAFGAPTFTDEANHSIRTVAADGNAYFPAALASGRTTTVSLALPSTATYGQPSAVISVAGTVPTPQGTIALEEGQVIVGSSTLALGTASISLTALAAGSHSLAAVYGGDGLNPAARSGVSSLLVNPAVVLATADAKAISYGETIPQLTGSVTGILTQDTGKVNAAFTTTAVDLSPPGIYPITAVLTGPASADYAVSPSAGSGNFQITQADVTVTEGAIAGSYSGLPLSLTATVVTTTRGTPTGSVQFVDNNTTVATAPLSNGVASATYLSPGTGVHTITAIYQGDTNFNTGSSASTSVTVNPMPDFSVVSTGSSSQTVVGGSVAVYNFSVQAQPAPFTGLVLFSVSGLPAGAAAAFAPTSVVPGAATAVTSLSITTPVKKASGGQIANGPIFGCILAFTIWGLRKRRRIFGALAVLLLAVTTTSCGDRVAPSTSEATTTYPLVVTATSTNLAGTVITHSVAITLGIQ